MNISEGSLKMLSSFQVCVSCKCSFFCYKALAHMNRLHEALAHLLSGLSILGKNQPRSDFGCYMMILKESLRHYLHVFLPGYYIGEAGYVSLSIQLSTVLFIYS